MAREYRHIQEYKNEILELKKQGLTHQEIGEKLGFTKTQVKEFFHRYNRNQRKLERGIVTSKKGRAQKSEGLPPSVLKQSQINQLKYELAEKERLIKRLEMENELMRDFLSLTERK